VHSCAALTAASLCACDDVCAAHRGLKYSLLDGEEGEDAALLQGTHRLLRQTAVLQHEGGVHIGHLGLVVGGEEAGKAAVAAAEALGSVSQQLLLDVCRGHEIAASAVAVAGQRHLEVRSDHRQRHALLALLLQLMLHRGLREWRNGSAPVRGQGWKAGMGRRRRW
jgi:hypothetical protein